MVEIGSIIKEERIQRLYLLSVRIQVTPPKLQTSRLAVTNAAFKLCGRQE